RTHVIHPPPGGVVALVPGGWLARQMVAEFRSGHALTVHAMLDPASWLLFYPLPFYPLLNAIRLVLLAYSRPPVAAADEDGVRAGTILAQYHLGALDRLELGTLFWHASSAVDSRRVIVLFDRPDSPRDANARAALERMGLGWVDARTPVYSGERPLHTTVA